MPSDDDRYVETRQKNLCVPAWEHIFDGETWKKWYLENRPRLREISTSQGFSGVSQSNLATMTALTFLASTSSKELGHPGPGSGSRANSRFRR